MPDEADELRDEYEFDVDDLRRGVRGKYAEKFARGPVRYPETNEPRDGDAEPQ